MDAVIFCNRENIYAVSNLGKRHISILFTKNIIWALGSKKVRDVSKGGLGGLQKNVHMTFLVDIIDV